MALTAGLVLLSAGGCVHYRAKALEPAQQAQVLASRPLADPGLKSFVELNATGGPDIWPPPEWGLQSLTLAALYFHPDLDVARSSWQVTRAREAGAGRRANPTMNVEPGYNVDTSTPSPWILTSLLSWSINTGGKRGIEKSRDHFRAEVARNQIAAVAWSVRSRVRQSMVALYEAQQLSSILSQEQQLHDENVRRTDQRHAAGLASGFEQTQAHIAAQRSRLALHDAQAQATIARLQLAQAIGVGPGALDNVALSFSELSASPTKAGSPELRTAALMNRADVLTGLASYAESESNLRLEIAKQYPDFNLGLGYAFDQGDSIWSLPMGISLPLFDRNQRSIAEAMAVREETAAKFAALQLRVLHAVAQAEAGYEAALQKSADADAMMADSEILVKRAEAMLATGEISSAEIVAARLEMSATSLARATTATAMLRAQGTLEDSLQSPLGVKPAAWERAPRTTAARTKGNSHEN